MAKEMKSRMVEESLLKSETARQEQDRQKHLQKSAQISSIFKQFLKLINLDGHEHAELFATHITTKAACFDFAAVFVELATTVEELRLMRLGAQQAKKFRAHSKISLADEWIQSTSPRLHSTLEPIIRQLASLQHQQKALSESLGPLSVNSVTDKHFSVDFSSWASAMVEFKSQGDTYLAHCRTYLNKRSQKLQSAQLFDRNKHVLFQCKNNLMWEEALANIQRCPAKSIAPMTHEALLLFAQTIISTGSTSLRS